jgi:hyperpolarization activated cyclic nucleotide-gated potassium channel 2
MTRYSLKILKGIRITKLFRIDAPVTRFYQWLKSFADPLEDHMSLRISDGVVKLLRLFLLARVVAHWIGCFNYMLVRVNDFPEDRGVVFASWTTSSSL